MSFGNYSFESSPVDPSLQTNVVNGASDSYQTNAQFIQISGPLFPLPGGNAQGVFTFFLEDNGASVFASTALPIAPPDLTLFESNWVLIQDNHANKVFLGSLDYLSLEPQVTPVPEPITIVLFATGIACLAGISARIGLLEA